jgi:hypothetical protein
MQSILQDTAFFAGFAVGFVLLAGALLIFLIFAPLTEAEGGVPRRRRIDQRLPPVRVTVWTRIRAAFGWVLKRSMVRS